MNKSKPGDIHPELKVRKKKEDRFYFRVHSNENKLFMKLLNK